MNAADILKYGHQTALQSIANFPETAWETPGACGYWSVKDIIAHLTSYEEVLVDILTSLMGKGSTPMLNNYLEMGDKFNDAEVEKRHGKTIQDILADFNAAHEQTIALIHEIPAETLRQNGTLPWYGANYCLDDVIVYMYYGHKREHSAQVAAFLDRLN